MFHLPIKRHIPKIVPTIHFSFKSHARSQRCVLFDNISVNMQSQQTSVLTCKNHPEVLSRFYLTEQPEVRYCKTCALNMALCGRKIERELAPQEYQRKVLLDSIVDKLRNNAAQIETTHAYYEQLLCMLQLSTNSISSKIETIDAFIKQLAQTKLTLEAEFENEVLGKSKAFQTRIAGLEEQQKKIAKQLENIESNFGSIIESDAQENFNVLKTGWNQLITKTSSELIDEVQFDLERNKIGDSVSALQRQLREVGKLRVFELPLAPLFQLEKENTEGEEFNCHRLIEQLKLNLDANNKGKLKGTKKCGTERQSKGVTKRGKNCIEKEEMNRTRRLNY